MDAGRVGVERERLFEERHGTREVTPRESDLTETRHHGHVARRQLRSALEHWLGSVRLALFEIQTAEPNQRGDFRRARVERARERLDRLLRLADALIEMPQVVRPPYITR